jgi:hypothetical protein
MEVVESVVMGPITEFGEDSLHLMNGCHKSDHKGFMWTWLLLLSL